MNAANPAQPIVTDAHGVHRFKANTLVDRLLQHGQKTGLGLNELAREPHSDEDRMQLAQLIGYSVDGYGTLGYVTDESYEAAEAAAQKLQDAQPPRASPLDSIALMRAVMRADEAMVGRCLRGTTNWAAAIGKAVQDAVLAAQAPQQEVRAVFSVHKAHLKHGPGPWCKEALLYSPENEGDSPENRVMLYTAQPAPNTDEADAARWRTWCEGLVDSSRNTASPFIAEFEKAIGDSVAPFTVAQLNGWVDAACAALAARGDKV